MTHINVILQVTVILAWMFHWQLVRLLYKETLNKWKLGNVVYALTVAHILLVLKPFNAVIQIDSDARVFYDV
ncbi:hypothetical protein [Sporosarcina ureae]|uniref:hypothetical protein n=1 Tax=Sporosarcina ureae TaxID=1571 RepID=UPI00040BEF4B|nr:hypothetical protein [Sporosarcina ureae]